MPLNPNRTDYPDGTVVSDHVLWDCPHGAILFTDADGALLFLYSPKLDVESSVTQLESFFKKELPKYWLAADTCSYVIGGALTPRVYYRRNRPGNTTKLLSLMCRVKNERSYSDVELLHWEKTPANFEGPTQFWSKEFAGVKFKYESYLRFLLEVARPKTKGGV
jgi:hypothetical protein